MINTNQNDAIVSSLMDVDFYKFTMGQFINKNYKGTAVKFSLINRDASVPLAKIINEQELREQLDYVRTLRLQNADLYYLRWLDGYGKDLFSENYLSFLGTVQMPEYNLRVVGDQFELDFQGPWEQVTFWETIALAIISELYYRSLMRDMSKLDVKVLYANATSKLYNKLKVIKQQAPGALISDFGQRRRHSFEWQQNAVEMAQEVLGDSFVGTSNTWIARNLKLTPIGTNAHELPMVVTALYEDSLKKHAQYDTIRAWGELYGKELKIVLPDTYGTTQFWKNMPEDLAHNVALNWRGVRQDSGDPVIEAELFQRWLLNKDTTEKKVCIFSDGLDYKKIIELYNRFQGDLVTPFGWGTMLTNDFIGCDPSNNPAFKPFSLVCKVTEANGNPAVKLSNNPGKATGPKDEVEKYKKIFGVDGQNEQEVKV